MRKPLSFPIFVAATLSACSFAGNPVPSGNGAAIVGPNITLDVLAAPSNGQPGYTATIASNGSTYSCRFTGGDGNTGDVTFNQRGDAKFTVTIGSQSSFAIDDVGFISDRKKLLWHDLGPVPKKTVTIHDRNTDRQAAFYVLSVVDLAAPSPVTALCDPKIVNR